MSKEQFIFNHVQTLRLFAISKLTKMMGHHNDVDDVLQESTLRIIRYYLNKPESDIVRVSTSIVKNECVNLYRKQNHLKRKTYNGFEAHELEFIVNRNENKVQDNKFTDPDAHERLMNYIIDQIKIQKNKKHKVILQMRYQMNMKILEIADNLQIPTGTVQATIARFKKKMSKGKDFENLKKILEESYI